MKMPKLKSLLKTSLDAALAFLYPPICLNCDHFLPLEHNILCENCFFELEPFSLEEHRCHNCFNTVEGGHGNCNVCHVAIFTSLLAVFPLMGAAAVLRSRMKSLTGSYLCKSAAAFMVIQLLQAGWPIPDLIIPLPQTMGDKIFSSHHHNAFIAKELASFLQCTSINPFSLNVKRMDFSKICPHAIKNKSLLLVSDVLTTNGKMHEYGEILAKGYPKHLYGIALCQAI